MLKRAAAGLLVTTACLAVAVLWLKWPRRLDLAIGELQATAYHAKAGYYAVTLALTPERARDHGPATLRIKTVVGEIVVPTYYNYDTLQDDPAGNWYLGWVDGDIWPDVIIETNPRVPGVWVVRSSDGMIREMSSH